MPHSKSIQTRLGLRQRIALLAFYNHRDSVNELLICPAKRTNLWSAVPLYRFVILFFKKSKSGRGLPHSKVRLGA